MSGTLPSEIGLLSVKNHLKFKDGGDISGTLPAEMANLFVDKFFYLQNNKLSGTVPSAFASSMQTQISGHNGQHGCDLSGNLFACDFPTANGCDDGLCDGDDGCDLRHNNSQICVSPPQNQKPPSSPPSDPLSNPSVTGSVEVLEGNSSISAGATDSWVWAVAGSVILAALCLGLGAYLCVVARKKKEHGGRYRTATEDTPCKDTTNPATRADSKGRCGSGSPVRPSARECRAAGLRHAALSRKGPRGTTVSDSSASLSGSASTKSTLSLPASPPTSSASLGKTKLLSGGSLSFPGGHSNVGETVIAI